MLSKYFALVIVPFLLLSCTNTGFLMVKAKVIMYQETYPSKEENVKIDVYRFKAPEKNILKMLKYLAGIRMIIGL